MILYVECSANYEIKPVKPIVCQRVRPKWNYWKMIANVLSTSHLQMEILTYILLLSRLFETLNEETLNKMEWKENNFFFLIPSFKSLIWEKDIECHKNLLIMLVLFFFIFFSISTFYFSMFYLIKEVTE